MGVECGISYAGYRVDGKGRLFRGGGVDALWAVARLYSDWGSLEGWQRKEESEMDVGELDGFCWGGALRLFVERGKVRL